jgi:spore maturation protein A
MIMSWIFAGFLLISLLFSYFSGNSPAAAVTEGAQAGITLAISLCGSLCLWSGVGHLMERIGLTDSLGKFFSPLLCRLFPSSRNNRELRGQLSANVCANLLGLGNAATPMGISAVKRMRRTDTPTFATDEMCRLIVLNTASIQLIPTNVAAVRSALGCAAPFDILPAVWITSLCSAGLGLVAAWTLGKVWRND